MTAANEKSYLFIGKVIGYTDVIKSRRKPNSFETEDRFYGEGRGLKIEPIVAINLPKVSVGYFEVYKFAVTSSCADKLTDLSYIKIGTKLRIVANESALLPYSDNNHIRLESKIFDRFSVVSNEFQSSQSLEFDYKNNWKQISSKLALQEVYERTAAFDDFIYLETNKDLLRLKNTASKKKRYQILERLLYNPKVDYPALISPVLNRYNFSLINSTDPGKERRINLSPTEKELLNRRKELEKSGFFK